MVGLLEEPYKSRVFQYGYCTMLQSCLLFGCFLAACWSKLPAIRILQDHLQLAIFQRKPRKSTFLSIAPSDDRTTVRLILQFVFGPFWTIHICNPDWLQSCDWFKNEQNFCHTMVRQCDRKKICFSCRLNDHVYKNSEKHPRWGFLHSN